MVQNGFNFDSFSSVKFPQRIVSPAPTTTFNTNIADKSMSFQPLPQSRSATVSPVIIQSENSPLMHTSNVQFNTPSQQIYLDKVQKVVTPVKSVEEQKPAVLVKHVEETKTIIAVDTSSSPPSVQQIPAPVQPIVAPV